MSLRLALALCLTALPAAAQDVVILATKAQRDSSVGAFSGSRQVAEFIDGEDAVVPLVNLACRGAMGHTRQGHSGASEQCPSLHSSGLCFPPFCTS